MDSQGNAVTLTYDANLRLVAVTDAIGQVTTLTYGLATNSTAITKVDWPVWLVGDLRL
jgi:YD repeat-containing protein